MHAAIRRLALPAVLAALLAGAGSLLPAGAAEEAWTLPKPALAETGAKGQETARLAGGCFWGVQGVFQHVKGVSRAVSGYAGGTTQSPSYEDVSTGTTGHAETVEVTFDPAVVSYGEILRIFFSVAHDPTTLNYQGPDHGTQYRSAVFPLNAAQKKVADAYVAQLGAAKIYDGRIVTTTTPAATFFPAEAYHQDFLARNPTYPYIAAYDMPKIENLKRLFPSEYRQTPVLVAGG